MSSISFQHPIQTIKPNTTSTKAKAYLFLKKAKKVLIIALKVIGLIGLCFLNGFFFAGGFICGFAVKCIKKDACSQAVRDVQDAIAKRPWLCLGVAIGISMIAPESLLVLPSLIGGSYAGIKVAKFCLE